MKALKNKFSKVIKDDRGASNVEIIVWISVVLILATALFAFGDTLVTWIGTAAEKLGGFKIG